MDTLFSLLVGLGLSAACGFRLFVPFLIISIAALSGHVSLPSGFAWIGTWPAFLAFGAATVLEVAGYYIPWVDHFLDAVAIPASVVAGTIATASMVTGMDPFMKWSVAIIAGGGVAGVIQGATVMTRAASSLATGGILNPLVATMELGGSIIGSLLAFMAPLLMMLGVAAIIIYAVVLLVRGRSPVRPTPV